jgi:pilus assembly protein CpaB
MRAKSLVLLVIALGCGMIAAVAVSKAVMDKGPEQTEAMVEIFVAVSDLPHAQKITAESVKLEKWPKSRVPEGALINLEQLEGKFTNQMIFANEPILERKLADSRESFSTTIPPGYRVFDIPGNAGYIKPGDHVDIVGTFKIGGRNGAAESRTVMRNVQVFGINGVTTRDPDDNNTAVKGTTFQLLVKESQLEALTLANSMGELRLNLRPFGEDSEDGSDTDNGDAFLSWINETESNSKPQSQESITSVSTTVESLFSGNSSPVAPIADKPKHEMVIITPNSLKRYQWSEATDLPQEVAEPPLTGGNSSNEGLQANPWGSSTGNVYSGYGGYSPTYPTSTLPQPASSGLEALSPGVKSPAIN